MMLSKANCRNVEAINVDFLTVEPSDPKYSAATHILLDPSCSGSGIVNRLDHLLEIEGNDDPDQAERLIKLSNFQLAMIRHAMKFPSVTKIVYSTCSIHAMENEHVVREALKSAESQAGNFKLAPRQDVLPTWPRRGQPGEMDDPEDAASLVRCSPDYDATNGFFVSCFVRRNDELYGSLPKKRKDRDNERRSDDGAKRMKRKKLKRKEDS